MIIVPFINSVGPARNVQTEQIYREFKETLRDKMESGDSFISGPTLLDRPYVGGWKVHVGLGLENSGAKEATLKGMGEFLDIVQNYSDRVLFKVGTFEKLDRLTNPANDQAGKGITIYVPALDAVVLPWLVAEMRNFVDGNRTKLMFVSSDQCRNFPVYLGGVISMRWASFFTPHGSIQKQVDAMEREAQAMCIIAEKAGASTLWSVMRTVL